MFGPLAANSLSIVSSLTSIFSSLKGTITSNTDISMEKVPMDKSDTLVIPIWWILTGIGAYAFWNSRDKAKLKKDMEHKQEMLEVKHKQEILEHKQEMLELKYEMLECQNKLLLHLATKGVKED
jgi:anaerobic C4-dicarboxylate transporter